MLLLVCATPTLGKPIQNMYYFSFRSIILLLFSSSYTTTSPSPSSPPSPSPSSSSYHQTSQFLYTVPTPSYVFKRHILIVHLFFLCLYLVKLSLELYVKVVNTWTAFLNTEWHMKTKYSKVTIVSISRIQVVLISTTNVILIVAVFPKHLNVATFCMHSLSVSILRIFLL